MTARTARNVLSPVGSGFAEQTRTHFAERRSANGTYDVGPLQFNTAYLASLRRFGITPRAVEGKTCYPWFLAAWRIHDQLVEDRGGFWTRVARYHSATPRYVAAYRRQLLEYAPRWRAWLIAQYPTVVSAQSRAQDAKR